ncbi:MAG: DUF1566 domain-containing protein [Sulfurovum sp.]|nr:DUF1566 domain-containing protein [Sulfurovum sp.]
MFNKLKKMAISNRAQDEILYEYVLEEIEQGIRTKGLWAKALAHSDGIESKAEAKYMQYRVQSIKDQFDALKIAFDEMSRESLFTYIKNGFKDPILEEKKAKERKEKEEKEREREEKERKERFRKPLQKEAKSSNSNGFMILFAIYLIISIIISILVSKNEQQQQPDYQKKLQSESNNSLNKKIKNNGKWIDPSDYTCTSNGGTISAGFCTASWDSAYNICKASEGKLPTYQELRKVVSDCGGTNVINGDDDWNIITDKNRANTSYQSCYQAEGFDIYTYWSDTLNTDNTQVDSVWGVFFKAGYGNSDIKFIKKNVRCVSLDKNLTSVASSQKTMP